MWQISACGRGRNSHAQGRRRLSCGDSRRHLSPPGLHHEIIGARPRRPKESRFRIRPEHARGRLLRGYAPNLEIPGPAVASAVYFLAGSFAAHMVGTVEVRNEDVGRHEWRGARRQGPDFGARGGGRAIDCESNAACGNSQGYLGRTRTDKGTMPSLYRDPQK